MNLVKTYTMLDMKRNILAKQYGIVPIEQYALTEQLSHLWSAVIFFDRPTRHPGLAGIRIG